MMFAAPWALWGMLLLAGPLLVHLLSRRTATRRLFPTLRFLDHARLQPVSRRTLDDRALLALRLGILALAALALSRPQWTDPVRAGARTPTDQAMVLLVDTSASMQRTSRTATRAVEEARRLADSAAVGVARVLRVESLDPAAAMPAAAAWVHAAGGGTLVLFTDAQRGSLVRSDVLALPSTVRLVVRPIPVRVDDEPARQRDAASDMLDVRPVQHLRDSSSPLFASERSTTHAIQVLALSRIAEHPVLREQLSRHPVSSATRAPERTAGWIAVPASPHADAAVIAWLRPSYPVVLQLTIDEAHPVATALVAITRESLHDAAGIPLRERESVTLDTAQLSALERTAIETVRVDRSPRLPTAADAGALSRGLWVAVLLALGGEWWLRRRVARVVTHV